MSAPSVDQEAAVSMQAQSRSLARRLPWRCCLALGALACASNPPRPLTPSEPQRYEGTCAFLGIEEAPGPGDQNSDSVSLVASYRLPEAGVHAQGAPVSLKFHVERSRVGDLRSHLEQHPNIVCRPGAATHEAGLESTRYTLDVPPFEGQSGELVR